MNKYLIMLLPVASSVACMGAAAHGKTVKAIFAAVLTVVYAVIAYTIWVGETEANAKKNGTH